MDPRRWSEIATKNQKELFKKWKNNLSDLLLIQKEGTDLFKAAVFFRNELDADIPFEKMGFLNHFEFFYHCQDILQLRASNNKYFLFIREDACPANQRHLRQLARGQANSKTRTNIGRGIKIRPTLHTTYPVAINSLLIMNAAQMSLNRVPSTITGPRKPIQSRSFQSSTSKPKYQYNLRSSQPRYQVQQQRPNPPKAQSQYPRQQPQPQYSALTYAPGPPIRPNKPPPPTSNQIHSNFDDYENESIDDYSSDEVDCKPSTSRPKYGYGENASTIPAYPVHVPFQTPNATTTTVPPPPMPVMNIKVTIDNSSSFHNRYLKALNSEEDEGHASGSRSVVPALPATSNTTTASTIPPQRPKEVLSLKNLEKDKGTLVGNDKNVSNHTLLKFDEYVTSSDTSFSSDEYEWVEKNVSIPTYTRPKEIETPKNATALHPSQSPRMPQIRPLMSIDPFERAGRSSLFANAINSVINQRPSNTHVAPGPSRAQRPVETSTSNLKNLAEIKNSSTSSVRVSPRSPLPIYKAGNTNAAVSQPIMAPFKNVENTNSLSNIAQKLSNVSLSHLNNLDENKENLLGKDKNILTSTQNKTSANELTGASTLVKKPEVNDMEKKKKEEQRAINLKKLEEKVGRNFVALVSYENVKIRTDVKPLPDFIDHEMVVVYVPAKNTLECILVNDILVVN